MKLDLSKWNPFKFFRKTPEEKRAESSPSTALATTAGTMPATWPQPSRPLMAEPFRMMQELLRDPFVGFSQLDRWFGDFSPSVFQPRIDVVDDGDALRITAELPGMDRQDVEILLEEDTLVLRGEHSTVLDRDVAERMVKELPHGRLVEIPSAVHTLHEDNPEAVLKALQEFLGFVMTGK